MRDEQQGAEAGRQIPRLIPDGRAVGGPGGVLEVGEQGAGIFLVSAEEEDVLVPEIGLVGQVEIDLAAHQRDEAPSRVVGGLHQGQRVRPPLLGHRPRAGDVVGDGGEVEAGVVPGGVEVRGEVPTADPVTVTQITAAAVGADARVAMQLAEVHVVAPEDLGCMGRRNTGEDHHEEHPVTCESQPVTGRNHGSIMVFFFSHGEPPPGWTWRRCPCIRETWSRTAPHTPPIP